MSESTQTINKLSRDPLLLELRKWLGVIHENVRIDLSDTRTSRVKAALMMADDVADRWERRDREMPLLLQQIEDFEDELIVEEHAGDHVPLGGLWSREDFGRSYQVARAELLRLGRHPEGNCLMCARSGHHRCQAMICGLHHDESIDCVECRIAIGESEVKAVRA
ncbi:MAG: hypothetical protein KY432_07380 [Acidobacteria bacterium]|nr:hypothetical protein [Acidobacteriota bacterium]